MRIKGVEKDLLFMNKIGEGKSFEEANYEVEEFKENQKKYYWDIMEMYKVLGYEISERENVDNKVVEGLLKTTEKQGKAQEKK